MIVLYRDLWEVNLKCFLYMTIIGLFVPCLFYGYLTSILNIWIVQIIFKSSNVLFDAQKALFKSNIVIPGSALIYFFFLF